MATKLTDDELLHLSPEEREFYESVSEEDDNVDEEEEPDFDENDYLDPDDSNPGEDDGDDDGDESASDDADGADADDGADDADGDDEGEEGEDNGADDEPGEGEDAKNAKGEGADESGDGADSQDDGYQQPRPALEYELPADWKERMDNVQTQLTELEAEWDDGEIEADAYKAKRAELRNNEKELDRQFTKAEIAADFHQQQAQNQWVDDVKDFFKDYPQFQPNGDTPDDNDNPLYDALDAHVVKIAKANPELSGKQVLSKALERFPESMRNQASKDEGKADTKSKTKAKGKQRRDVPPTLRNVPASSVTETDSGGKFAHLDKLDGVALEKAMARMSDAERDAYMRT